MMLKWSLLVLLVALLIVVTVLIVVTQVEKSQATKNESLRSESRVNKSDAKTTVVVFSRSGNTGVLAQHIADKYRANLFTLQASDYDLGVPGLINALKDARSNIATIEPATVDLANYTTVYLGAPIWLYSPAPPIWQFASNNDFTGKKVVLFNSFNSYFGPEFIDAFEALVRAQGAIDFEHRYVKRGRMGSQLTTEEMLKKFDEQEENSDRNNIDHVQEQR